MQKTFQLYLLRHATTCAPAGLCYGCSDIAADAAATESAARAALQQLPRPAHILLSPLQRTRQLARAIAAQSSDWPLAQTDARIQEMHFGRYEQQPWDSIAPSILQAWTDDFAYHHFGGGESTWEFLQRVAQALAATRLIAREAQRQQMPGPQLWITHAGVIHAVHYLLQRGLVPPENAQQWPQTAPSMGGWGVVAVAYKS